MIVLAFDRDWTVDVNPHPRHEAVPLEWVRHLAHVTDHPVYAIGNQDLADEAAIPGVVDVVGRHPDDWDEWLGDKQPDGRYERFPLRRERLELIADLHPDADSYVVVDDLDLGDVDGWDHYHAWEFVPAVERGDIDPDLPWAREPVADGGSPTIADIEEPDPDSLSAFLEEHDGVPGYELTDTAEGTERTRSCYDVTVIRRSVERPSAIPAVRCTPIEPKQDRFHVPIDSIASVTAIGGQPTDVLLSYEGTAEEEARFLHRLSTDNPRAVDVSSLVSLLGGDSDETRVEALRALAIVAKVSTRECVAALPVLESLLESGELSTPAPALATVGTIAGGYPDEVAPLVDAIVPYLGSDEDVERVEAARCVMEVAEEDPTDAVDAVPALATLVEDGGPGQEYAVYTLTCLSREYPEAIKPVAGDLSRAVTNEDLDDGVRLNATAALGRVVGEYPAVAVSIVDDVVDLFGASDGKLRNNAIGLVGDVAQVHSDVVEPHTDAVADLLTSEDDYARINASGCLARVAEEYPDSVGPYVDRFVELLTDDRSVVRKNACGALGHLGAEEAEMELVERAGRDESEAVRERAEWALHRIQR